MDSPEDLGPVPGRHLRERESLCEALAHYVFIVASPTDKGLERECLCEALARGWLPFEADVDDDCNEERKREAKLWMNWNLESYESDSPDREPTDPADGK